MDNNRRSLTASITVFFALLILPLMALVLVVLKAVSSHIEQNDCIRMTMTAGNALLSCYDSKLAHRYGLYGADQELLERYFPDRAQTSLFEDLNKTEEEYIVEAYRCRNDEIGFKLEDLQK